MSLKSINGVTQVVTDVYQMDGQLFDPHPLQSIFRVSLGGILNPNLQNDLYCNVIQLMHLLFKDNHSILQTIIDFIKKIYITSSLVAQYL